MTALSPSIGRTASRVRFAGPVILALILGLVVLAAAVIAMNAAAAGIGGSNAGYDAPYYSEYVQHMAQGW